MGHSLLPVITRITTVFCLFAGLSLGQISLVQAAQDSVEGLSSAPLPSSFPNLLVKKQTTQKTKKIGIVIFPGYESLDVFGPVQMWGRLPVYELVMVSEHGGPVTSAQGVTTIANYSFDNAPELQIMMIPGGKGTREEVRNPAMLDFIRKQDRTTQWTVSVCTGSAVLAKAGVLKGRKATSNKMAFKFATSQDSQVLWQGHARWIVDGKYVTSSGVSAGTDMALGLVEKLYDRSIAERTASGAEYIWNDDASKDPFAVQTNDGQ